MDVCLYKKTFLSYIYANPTPAVALHRSVYLIICTACNRRHLCSEYSKFLVPIQTNLCTRLVAFSANLGLCTTCTGPYQSITKICLSPFSRIPASVVPFNVHLGMCTTGIGPHYSVTMSCISLSIYCRTCCTIPCQAWNSHYVHMSVTMTRNFFVTVNRIP